VAAAAPGILAVFGPGFVAGATALSILIFVVVLEGYGRTAGGLLAACDRPGVVSIVSAGAALLNVALCLLLIPPLELTGAALANLGGWLFAAAALLALAAGQAQRSLKAMVEPGFLLRLGGACAVLALTLVPLREVEAALVWQCLAALPALTLGLVAFRPLAGADLGTVERALASAGIRSERLRRAVRRGHDLASRD
jgi:O-antigen/teichoic acid export membrane protein